MKDDDYKNTLPGETDDHPDSGMPRQLRTQNDKAEPLSRAEADVAGITSTPEMVYGEASGEAEDQKDRFASSEEQRR
jgi:hypothetical protein